VHKSPLGHSFAGSLPRLTYLCLKALRHSERPPFAAARRVPVTASSTITPLFVPGAGPRTDARSRAGTSSAPARYDADASAGGAWCVRHGRDGRPAALRTGRSLRRLSGGVPGRSSKRQSTAEPSSSPPRRLARLPSRRRASSGFPRRFDTNSVCGPATGCSWPAIRTQRNYASIHQKRSTRSSDDLIMVPTVVL
jgi:hypothetical protein